MKTVNIVAAPFLTAMLAACGSGNATTASRGDLIGPGATLAEARVAIDTLFDEVDTIEILDGETAFIARPLTSASYSGIIYGDDIIVDHAGDLTLTAVFSSNSISGNATNFVTNIPNFENPTGTVPVSGTISNDAGVAVFDFTGSATLTGDGVSAEWEIFDVDGVFVGDNADALRGTHRTDVFWLSGPRTGFDFSYGEFAATRD